MSWTAPVREYASKPIISVLPDTPLADVQHALSARDISAVLVVDEEGAVVGVLSSTDLMREARIEIAAPGEVARITPPPQRARDLMRTPVVTVDEDAPLHEAARKMVEHRIHRVFVTSADRAVGVLSTRDAMRAIRAARVETPLERVMTSPVMTIDSNESIRNAVTQLDDLQVHGLVVVEGSWPIGVFTHTEAIQARALPPAGLDAPVERVMSCETICFETSTPIHRVVGHAIAMRVRRILAVEHRDLRGVVTGFDLLRVMLEGDGARGSSSSA